MKLIIFTGLLAACSAASLEHLEKQQNGYLPSAKNSSISPSADSGLEGSLGADTNAIGASSIDQPGFTGRASVPVTSKQNLPSDNETSSLATDPEFSGYFYGPGIQNNNNQQPNYQASQFDNQTPNQQFDLQGTNKYSSPQTRNQLFSSQEPKQQFGQQPISQQYAQQAQNQQFKQQPITQQYTQQAQNQQFGQQSISQQYAQPGQNQQFGQRPISQQYAQQTQNQQFGQRPTSQQYVQQAQNQQFGQQPISQHYTQQDQNQQFSHHLGSLDASPQGSNSFSAQARFQPRPSFANAQDFASHSSQNYPQQSFDEETGYHY